MEMHLEPGDRVRGLGRFGGLSGTVKDFPAVDKVTVLFVSEGGTISRIAHASEVMPAPLWCGHCKSYQTGSTHHLDHLPRQAKYVRGMASR